MMCRSSAENMKTFRPTGRGRTAVHPQFGWHSLRCPLDSALYSAFPSCQGQAPVKQTAKECFPYRKGAFSFYLFLVPHKVPWVQDVELQGRDKSGLVVSCGKPVSCPHWGMLPTYLHFFTVTCLSHFGQRCLQWAWLWQQQLCRSQEWALHWLCLTEAKTLSGTSRQMN